MKRASGILMHISSLWGEYGCGSFGKSAFEWIDFLASAGFSYWQVLPFCMPDGHFSPYSSASTFSVNPFFIDLELLQKDGLLTKEELASAKQASPYLCEFDRFSERFELLKTASMREDRNKVLAFAKAHKQTSDFCTFMAKKAANNNLPWQKWTNKNFDKELEFAWLFTQYKFFEQWKKVREYANKKGVSIIGDLPIYVSLDSADVCFAPKQFQLDKDNSPTRVAAVPPDYFSQDGQLWGNPLYDWERMKKDNFSWWRNRIAFMCELFDGIRIDHFRAIEAYYSVDTTAENARNGVWVKGPGKAFIDAIKNQAGSALLIAEDLGIITDEVVSLIKYSGFPSMRVFQFAFDGDKNSPHLPHNYPANCIAYTGTHDNNTLLGFVWEMDEQKRKDMLNYIGFNGEWNSCYSEIMRTILASHANLVIFPVQDILGFGADTRLNTPGVATGNWLFRVTKEQLNRIDINKFLQNNKTYARF